MIYVSKKQGYGNVVLTFFKRMFLHFRNIAKKKTLSWDLTKVKVSYNPLIFNNSLQLKM